MGLPGSVKEGNGFAGKFSWTGYSGTFPGYPDFFGSAQGKGNRPAPFHVRRPRQGLMRALSGGYGLPLPRSDGKTGPPSFPPPWGRSGQIFMVRLVSGPDLSVFGGAFRTAGRRRAKGRCRMGPFRKNAQASSDPRAGKNIRLSGRIPIRETSPSQTYPGPSPLFPFPEPVPRGVRPLRKRL
ncbi:MAG: hypothetical protein CW346_02185 [Bacillaceae bacterium]|nr:hypothetical protein [Bacillaceae bacterium]OUM90950.1 MAG: hypothetical protein BAA03_11595 [Caldibacillus debilis]